jgi:ribosome-associated heat shock protein Hsp15
VDDPRQRLDKFLVYARFVKTRALATELIKRGRVRLNGARLSKPDRQIGPGDILTLSLPHGTEVVRLLDLPDRRGSAQATTALYERLTDGGADKNGV